MNIPERSVPVGAWILRFILFAVIIGIGVAAFLGLARLRQPAPRRGREELIRSVVVMTAKKQPERIMLTGYGTVRPKNQVTISSEIAGRVVAVAARAEEGIIVEPMTVLCRIDDRDLLLAGKLAAAEKSRLQAELAVLEQEKKNVGRLLELRREALKLEEAELARVNRLLQDGRIGTQSDVDRARQATLRGREQVVALENRLAQIPLQIRSLETQVQRVELQLAQNALQLERTQIKAPFRGRLAAVNVEVGQIVAPGQPLFRLIADREREIIVSLDTQQVTRWLIPAVRKRTVQGWFEPIKPVPVEIRWTGSADRVWPGTLTRVVGVDEQNRTVQLQVDLAPAPQMPFDLTAGMFCEVRIPGHLMPDVIRFPRAAANGDGLVYVAVDGRLAGRRFELLTYDGEDILARAPVSDDKDALRPGDKIILTKLNSVVEGMKVAIRPADPQH